MNRKFVLIALIVLIVSAGIAFAGETVKVKDCEFKVPDGYHKTNESDYKVFLKNDEGDFISIEVQTSYSDKLNVYGDSSTIGDKEGVLRTFNEGQSQFIYQDGMNMITITAPDTSVIENIIS